MCHFKERKNALRSQLFLSFWLTKIFYWSFTQNVFFSRWHGEKLGPFLIWTCFYLNKSLAFFVNYNLSGCDVVWFLVKHIIQDVIGIEEDFECIESVYFSETPKSWSSISKSDNASVISSSFSYTKLQLRFNKVITAICFVLWHQV